MDNTILNNTEKYAKTSVTKMVNYTIDKGAFDRIEEKMIYVVKKPEMEYDPWRAILVDAFCQSGKTAKCFQLLSEKIQKNAGNTLVLLVTQANSTAAVKQIIQRAKNSPEIQKIIAPDHIYRSNAIPDAIMDHNTMIVDFWHSSNMDTMLSFVKETGHTWSDIVIVIDEVEQAGLSGVKNRLSFIRKIEKAAPESIVNVMFITATIANLSKCILAVANADLRKFETGVVHEIINKPVVEHHYAKPHPSYVGASWFKETPGVWKKIVFPKREPEMTKADYLNFKRDVVLEKIKALPAAAKELSLIVTSTKTSDHQILAERLYRIGYNVTVELNGKLNKNFKVNYINKSGGISTWTIPYAQIDARADRGDIETYCNSYKRIVESGITQKEDYSMSHVLQASLFMMTQAEKRIKANISKEEFRKLDGLSNCIANLEKTHRRPADYPKDPKVALVAGHLAGRGITIQNPAIDFSCTSFCFTGTNDTSQRGATNTQRIGRAFGMLNDIFTRPGRQPILIATEGIMRDAVANELALQEKAEEIENGTLISLKDLISQEDWTRVMKQVKNSMKEKGPKSKGGQVIDGVNVEDLKRWYKSKLLLVGKMIQYLYKNENKVTFKNFKKNLGYSKSDKQFQTNLDNGRGIHCCYGMLWINENDEIILNPRIRTYLNNL